MTRQEGLPGQDGVYAPELRVREIPFDLRRAMALEEPARMIADLGKETVLDFVALNLVAEFGETLLFYLSRKYGMLAQPGQGRSFVHQELRHASALHVVNRRFVGDCYVRTEFGKLSEPCRVARAPVLMKLLDAEQPERREAVLYQMSLELAAFETTYGLLAQIPQFELLEQDPAPFLRYPAFSYVMLYHAAEEAEHTHVSWQHHRRVHGVDIFEPAQHGALLGAVERVLDDVTRVSLLTAREMQLDLDVRGIRDVFVARGRRRLSAELEAGSFHPSHYSAQRQRCVKAWDEHWEPQFRRAVEERLEDS